MLAASLGEKDKPALRRSRTSGISKEAKIPEGLADSKESSYLQLEKL
jgi:hypothetical protein